MELQYGDEITLSPILTEGHLCGGFVNGKCYPTVTVHEGCSVEGLGVVTAPKEFERCVFSILRPTEDMTGDGVRSVTYGSCVRLCSVVTNQVLQVVMQDTEEGERVGLCFAGRDDGLTLEETFRLLPRGKIREEGEVVRAGEQLLVESVSTAKYLAVGPSFSRITFSSLPNKGCKPTGRCVELLDAPTVETVWAIEAFDARSAQPEPTSGGTLLRVGDPVVLFHKEKEAFLEGDPSTSTVLFTAVKPPKATYSVRDVPQPSTAIWIIESNSIMTGGSISAATLGGPQVTYRLRHLATGKYLCCHIPQGNPNIAGVSPKGKHTVAGLRQRLGLVPSVTSGGIDTIDGTLVGFYPLDRHDDFIKAGGYARLEMMGSSTWVHCTSDLVVNEQGSGVKYQAGVAPRALYEDLFAVHHAEYGIAPALVRVTSMLPLLHAAADVFETKQTYTMWNDVTLDSSPKSASSLSFISDEDCREELLAAISPLIKKKRQRSFPDPSTPTTHPYIYLTLSAAIAARKAVATMTPKPTFTNTPLERKQQNVTSVTWMYKRRLYKRSELLFLETDEAIASLGSDKLIKTTLEQLKQSAWRYNLKMIISNIITVLSDLIAFVSGEEIAEGVRMPNLPLSTATAVSDAEDMFSRKLVPVKKGQKILFEQGVHHLVFRIVAAPFQTAHITLDNIKNYESLSVILRLCYRLIMVLVAGYEQASTEMVSYMSFFETQSGYRLNAADTIHAIVHNHPKVLSQIKDSTIKRFVLLVPMYGRSPSYLNLLSALCVTNGEGVKRAQDLVCEEILRLQDQPCRLLHRTRLFKGVLQIEHLAESEDRTFNISSVFDLVTPQVERAPALWQGNLQWIPMQDFITSGLYKSVKYYERQLNLMAALCAGNPECREKVAELIPRDHILVALEKGLLSKNAGDQSSLGDAVRTCFLALARMLYLQPGSEKQDNGEMISRWKRLLCDDIKRNTALCTTKIGRNEQVCESLRCLLLLVENGMFTLLELEKLAPILVQLLDPSTDSVYETTHTSLTSGAAKLVGYFSTKKDATSGMWQQAVVEALPKAGHDDPKFKESEDNKTVTGCKLVACQLLDAAERQGLSASQWVEHVETQSGVIKGAHGLSKVLLEVTMYQGDMDLFSLAFRLLCKSLVDDPLFAGYGDFPPEADGRENSAVTGFSSIIKQDVLHRSQHIATSHMPSGVIVRHFVSYFSNTFSDSFSVNFVLRVFTHLINSEKEKGGEEAMRIMQCSLDRLGCTLLMSSLIEAPDESIVKHALDFGIALLEGGNYHVQTQLMAYFHSISDEAFFQCIRNKLHAAIVELKDVEVKEKRRWLTDTSGMSHRFPLSPARVGPSFKIMCVTKTLRLLQLFCEGHNHELQCYIHSQPDNLHSVDLVKESLLVLKAVISVPPACFESILFDLLLQCFNSLTEYCQGPCKPNQETLVNAHLAKEVSTVLKLEYESATGGRITREQTDEMQNAATITLLSLLEGCEDDKVPSTLMQNEDLMYLIGNALDACWAHRKRGNDDVHDTALELGFNLFIFMETLSAFDQEHILLENRFFMRDEKGFAYYQAMTGRIEIAVKEGRLQRVYFRVPELCLNLSKTTKRRILWSVDRDTPSARLLSFFSMADDALFEMKYNDKHFSRKACARGSTDWEEGRYLQAVLTLAAVFIHKYNWEIHSLIVYLSILLCFLNTAMVEQDASIFMYILLYCVGVIQLCCTTAACVNKAISEGPVLAHKRWKNHKSHGWSRRSASEDLLMLRQAPDDSDSAPSSIHRKASDLLFGSPKIKRNSPRAGIGRRASAFSKSSESPNLTCRLTVPTSTRRGSPLRMDGRMSFNDTLDKDPLLSSTSEKVLNSSHASLGKCGRGGMRRLSKPEPLLRFSDVEDEDDGLGPRSLSGGMLGGTCSPVHLTPRRRMSEQRPSPISFSSPEMTASRMARDRYEAGRLLPPDMSSESTPSPLYAPEDDPCDLPPTRRQSPRPMRRGSPMVSCRPVLTLGIPQEMPAVAEMQREGREEGFGPHDVLLCLVKDPKFLAHCFMVLCSVLGLAVSPFFFTSQLFSIVSNSPILQSVIRSITKNGKSLLLTGLLAVIVVYHFAVAGFVFFRSSYQNSAQTTATIFRTFVHTLFNGIASGGISDLLHPPEFDEDGDGSLDSLYGLRMGFEFSFFVIVIVILLNIIFGIIIDTFAELRAEKQKVEEEIRTKCFICGIESSEFDRHAAGFECHIKRDHNMWFYIYFIHHLRTKDQSEFTGQESFVWNKMMDLDLSFFPSNKAICLQDKGGLSEDEAIDKAKSRGKNPADSTIESKITELWTELRNQSRKIESTDKRTRELLTAVGSLISEVKRGNGTNIEDSPHSARMQRNRSHGSFRFPEQEPKATIARHASLGMNGTGKW
eukprot:TRINITY_DN1291_c0_g2_i1.p1 TRINITY_DN1291_c0_g2~~TRINITY_DN1291_c0_g2_i1.p1  ORF type:complete len:2382 (+),score=530.56 TRINITY_DN1291_c0_g2_i1:118-7263(+)